MVLTLFRADTGRARAGWYASMQGLGVSANLESRLKSKSQVALGKTEGRFKAELRGKVKGIEMVNSVPYILRLEYGWSQQAPFGMVRISMKKLSRKFRDDLRSGFRDSWNKSRGSLSGGISYSDLGSKEILFKQFSL